MSRYDSSVRCAQIRELIEEKQYLEAMEEIEELNFEEIPTITDLYLFADLFLKAEKMDIAKELYYTVYRRTSSRPALYRLEMLIIRMGDFEEARELYQAYEIISGMTLDTYELKYRLAKAEGASYANLIEILEELKQNEYTEEWGYQLARLYELQGRREDCIAECEDIVLWFGSGKIVEKARELRERCLDPHWKKPNWEEIPEPEEPEDEEDVKVAYAPAQVMDIVAEKPQEQQEVPKAVRDEDRMEERIEEPVMEESVVEEPAQQPEHVVEESELEQSVEEFVDKVDEELPEETEDNEEQPKKKGFLNRVINYFKVDLDMFDEDEEFLEEPDEEGSDSQESDLEDNDVDEHGKIDELDAKTLVAKETQEIMQSAANEKLARDKVEKMDMPKQEAAVKRQTTTQLESLEGKLEEMKEKRKVINLEDTMNLDKIRIKSHPLSGRPMEVEVCEDVSVNGITYCTLKSAIKKISTEERTIHFALAGAAPGISLAVAKKLFKELKKNQYFEAKNIGKIQAEKLDEVDLEDWIEKFIGGCMYIENAPALSEESVENLRKIMQKYGGAIVIVLEGDYEKLDDFLGHHRNLEKQICYKIRL
ncbi:MAG: hypothetical protein ACI4SQ_04285 [Eubacterium sp.]